MGQINFRNKIPSSTLYNGQKHILFGKKIHSSERMKCFPSAYFSLHAYLECRNVSVFYGDVSSQQVL